jgi:hypothetical protein
MVAFISQIPLGFRQGISAIPVQINSISHFKKSKNNILVLYLPHFNKREEA